MGNSQATTYNRLNTSCALDDDDPEPIDPPTTLTLISQKIELLCCPCFLNETIIQSRHFAACELPRISTGDVFVLEAYHPPQRDVEGSSVVAKATSGLMHFFSSSASALRSTEPDSMSSSSSSSSSSSASTSVSSDPENIFQLVGKKFLA